MRNMQVIRLDDSFGFVFLSPDADTRICVLPLVVKALVLPYVSSLRHDRSYQI